MKERVLRILKRRDYLLVAGLWFAVELLLYSKFGFYFQMEAEKYIGEARFLIENHHLSQGRFLFYLGTILIIALNMLLETGLYGAVGMLLLINLGSYLYLYKALKAVFGRRLPALLAISFLLAFWPYQSWSLFLYTESLFYSLVMLLFARLLLFRSLDPGFVFTTFLLLGAIVLSRPLGILFVFPVLSFFYFHLNRRQRVLFYAALFVSVVLLAWVVQIVFTTTPDWNMQRAFLEENIICDMPVVVNNPSLDISQHPNQLYRLGYYITHNFSHFAGLAGTRLRYFFLNTRSYYSFAHNAYLLMCLALIYGGIVVGYRSVRQTFPTAIRAFVLLSVLFFALAVAFQCDDYHNRFFLTLVPMLVAFATAGYRPFIERVSAFFSKSHKG